MEYQSPLHKKLHDGVFVFTAETTPPDAASKETLISKIKPLASKLDEYLKITVNFTNWIKDKMKNSKDDVSAACNDYLRVLGLIALAYSWLKVLDVSYKELNNNKKFFEGKIETANFFFQSRFT